MKHSEKKPGKTNKGMPSAVLLSILIHASLFILGGMLVVFTVTKVKEPEFVAPKAVDRPKMKLRKPKVQLQKNSKPKSTTRIVTRVNQAAMPDIQLPEMSGMGNNLSGGLGDGFEMLPDFETVSSFGGSETIGNDLEGTFYDFKRDRSGRSIPMNQETFADKLTQFVESGWDTSFLAKYYQSPQKLYATSIMIPMTKSVFGPRAYGEETAGWCWMVLYKGMLVYPEDIKFRFWGYGDDLLMVRVNGEMVLNANYHEGGNATFITAIGGSWDSTSSDDAMYWYGSNKARVGDWIELKAGEPLEMEVVIGEIPGGEFSAMLTVQVDGVEYERNRQDGPILPMFMTAEPSRALQDVILRDLVEGEASVTNFQTVFRDFMVEQRNNSKDSVADTVEEETLAESEKHIWTTMSGKTMEAKYLSTVAGNVILESAKGKQVKVPQSNLSEADRIYLELLNPPEFNISFIKLSESKMNRYTLTTLEMEWGKTAPRVNDFTFGAKAKQKGAGAYHHELKLEYFAIGQELLGNKYVLLDRQSATFVPTKENDMSFEFKGDPIEFLEFELEGQLRGIRPDGNLIILTDERNRVIQHYASKSWLWEHFENLKKLPVGAYMDKTCTRVYPTSPKSTKW